MTFFRKRLTGEIRRRRARRMAEVALGRYGLRDARPSFLGELGFKDVFRVSAAEGDFVLRMYDAPRIDEPALHSNAALRTGAGLRSPGTLRSQLTWLSALRRETSLLLPEPFPTRDGELVGYVSVEDIRRRRTPLPRRERKEKDPGRHFMLLRWIPGRRKEDPSPADLSLAGAYVARLHRHSELNPVGEETALPRWDHRWPFGEQTPLWRRGGTFYSPREVKVFEDTAHRVREELGALGGRPDVFGPIHRDLQPKNFVFDGRTVGAVDFDLCGLGHYLLDLTVTLHWLDDHYGDRCAHLQGAYLKGYHEERPLPAGYEEHLKAFRAMMTVASVNGILQRLEHGATGASAPEERFLRNAVKRLADYDSAMSPLVRAPALD